jgi:uncharacterized phage-associated protein
MTKEINFEKAVDGCFYKNDKNSTKIADFFIEKANENIARGSLMTNLKLQKLLYYSYVWKLVLNNEKIFNDDIEAFEFGPVVRKEYTRFKKYSDKPIKVDEILTDKNLLPSDLSKYLNTIWYSYGKYDAWQLVDMTHNEKPWIDTFNPNSNKKQIIKDSLIRDFYTIENADILLPENTVIRELGNNNYELFVLNNETVKAINTPESEYKKFEL